jgi:hypothetical protein
MVENGTRLAPLCLYVAIITYRSGKYIHHRTWRIPWKMKLLRSPERRHSRRAAPARMNL